MTKDEFSISSICKQDLVLVRDFITKHWGSIFCVSKGKIHDVSTLPGYIYKDGDFVGGLITYCIKDDNCEIVTLNSKYENMGLGSDLIRKVINEAKRRKTKRVWLITTNDNVSAIRFYQKRGFAWSGFYKDTIKKSRELKPQIPEFGNDGIPIKHEIEFEYLLD